MSALHWPPYHKTDDAPFNPHFHKAFLWNRVPHRSRLPACLFPFSWHRGILAEQAAFEMPRSWPTGSVYACVTLCRVSLCWMSELLRALWPIPREPFTMQPASFSSSPLIVSKMFFQPYVIVCRLSRVNPPVNNSSLNWMEIHT